MSQPTKYLTDFLELCHQERVKPSETNAGAFALPHVTPRIALREKAAAAYDATILSLLDDFGRQDAVSVRAVESVLSRAVASVLDAKNQSVKSVADRVRVATRQVRDDLSTSRNRFTCYLPIRGANSKDLPILFGNVRLVKSGQAQERRLVSHTKSKDFRKIIRRLSDLDVWSKPYAVATVRAYDHDAAQVVARTEVRRALDCMNFLGEFIPFNYAWLHFPSEGDSALEAGAVTCDDGSMSLPHTATGPIGPFRFDSIESSQDSRRYWRSVSKLLKRNTSGTGGDAILGAIQWAGRAKVDPRREQAFLLYAISLESAMLPSKKSELGYRLSLRVSRLLGGNATQRSKTMKVVSDMYDVRSKVVHSGSFAVSATDLQRMRWLTTRVLRRLLARPKYFSLTTAEYESALELLVRS